VVVPLETHGPSHRPDFEFASLLFKECPRRTQIGVRFVAARTPEHVAVAIGILLIATHRARSGCVGF
jgi:hypothetical protein